MNLFQRKASGKLSVGIEIRDSGLAIAVCGGSVGADDSKKYDLRTVKIIEKQAVEGELDAALRDWVDEQSLKGCTCHLTLRNGSYQLLLTEAPEVPDAELRSAVRWKIGDLTTIPLESAAIDAFLLPADGTKSGKRMAYVVVTELARIKELIGLVESSGLVLNSIDIAELSLRNLSLLRPEGQDAERGISIVRMREGGAVLHIYRAGSLYLTRQFNLEYGGGLLDDIPEDSFLLEVQRSLDYFERQMGQAPPAMLYVCGENMSVDKVTQNIARGLSVPAQFLDLEGIFAVGDAVELDLIQECTSALGAALRLQVA